MKKQQRLKGNLDVLLLAILKDGPSHGYGVISDLRDRSNGDFDLPEGTVYPALHRLEDAGLIVSNWDQVDGRRRCIYSLSGEGAKALRDQRNEWKAFATSMDAVLGWAK